MATTTIRANTCPYCEGPYTLRAGGCTRRCEGSGIAARLVREAIEADLGEADDSPDPIRDRYVAYIRTCMSEADQRDSLYAYDVRPQFRAYIAAVIDRLTGPVDGLRDIGEIRL